MKKREEIIQYAIGVSLIIILGLLFYNSIIIGIILSPLSIYYVKEKKKSITEKQRHQLNLQFKDAIYSISSALNAGYSIENAFKEAYKDLKLQYIDPNTQILREFEYIIKKIEMNITIEEVLLEFASRTEIEDIQNFADVFITCKRAGGDIIKIIRSTSKTIGDKIEVNREIDILISAKKFEQKVMSLIPFGIILYMWLTSPGFLDIMYNTFLGRVVMTICLIIYFVAYKLSEKIMNIQV